MKQEETLREALAKAKARGICIRRGAVFDWTPEGISQPTSCNATGAILLAIGENSFSPGWLKRHCAYLDVDTFWCWRFWMGFDHNHVIQWLDKDDVAHDDDVSLLGQRLAKEFTRYQLGT